MAGDRKSSSDQHKGSLQSGRTGFWHSSNHLGSCLPVSALGFMMNWSHSQLGSSELVAKRSPAAPDARSLYPDLADSREEAAFSKRSSNSPRKGSRWTSSSHIPVLDQSLTPHSPFFSPRQPPSYFLSLFDSSRDLM